MNAPGYMETDSINMKGNPENILKRREESDTYLTHVCRHCWSRKSLMKIDEIGAFSQHCAFMSYRHGLTSVNRCCWGKKGSKGGGGRVRLSDVDTGRMIELHIEAFSSY